MSLCTADAVSRRNPHNAIALVPLQVANQRRERSSETLRINKQPVSRRITWTRHLTVDLSITLRLSASKTSYTPERAKQKITIIVAPRVDTRCARNAIY